MRLTSLYAALPWALLYFVAMVGIGHMSFKFIEGPPLRFRKPYIKAKKSEQTATFAR
jgi:peptidoglycan/LPS O-acetylase OafA/YrhL